MLLYKMGLDFLGIQKSLIFMAFTIEKQEILGYYLNMQNDQAFLGIVFYLDD